MVATPLFTTHLGHYDFTFTAAQPLAAFVVILATAINYFSVRIRWRDSGSADFTEDGRDPGHCDRRGAIRNERLPATARLPPARLGLGNDWRLTNSPGACDVGIQRLQ